MTTIYSGFQLCPDLKSGYRCIRLRKYSSGSGPAYTELFHEHIRKHRLSEDAAVQLVRALVLVYSGAEAPGIVRCYLNDRGGDPPRDPRLQITTEYPERGVLRKYCGGDVQAWVDTVVGSDLFRKQDEEPSHKGSNLRRCTKVKFRDCPQLRAARLKTGQTHIARLEGGGSISSSDNGRCFEPV